MKKIIYIPIIVFALLFQSCNEDFLNHDDLFSQSSESFYQTPGQIENALAAAYSQLVTDGGRENPTFLSNLMSDECFGSGGTEDYVFHDADAFQNTEDSQYEELWRTLYAGLLRANLVIDKIDDVEYKNPDDKNQAKGEAYFLRALYHYRITQFFGKAVISTSPTTPEFNNDEIDAFYAQIAADLKTAIDIMPAVAWNTYASGHATKWAAEALMARVFLFYTGVYNQTQITLPDGGVVTKANVISWIDDCIANSGHDLVSDFRNLWPYAACGSEDTTGYDYVYPYAKDEGLDWVGDGNEETVFAVKFSVYSSHSVADPDNPTYSNILSYSNQLSLYMGVRAIAASDCYPYHTGWGGGQVNPNLWNAWPDNDIRKQGSILNITDNTLNEGIILDNFEYNIWGSKDQTGMFNKKYTQIAVNTNAGPRPLYFSIYGSPSDYMLNNMQDEVLIRFSDVLLMGAELGSANAQSYFDRVRTRAGLASLPVSLENIQNERNWELAFEGLRYWDILRWGIAEEKIEAANGTTTRTEEDDVTYSVDFRMDRMHLPIPMSEILLSEGKLQQSEGWR